MIGSLNIKSCLKTTILGFSLLYTAACISAYKCVDENGNITFSDKACAPSEKSGVVDMKSSSGSSSGICSMTAEQLDKIVEHRAMFKKSAHDRNSSVKISLELAKRLALNELGVEISRSCSREQRLEIYEKLSP